MQRLLQTLVSEEWNVVTGSPIRILFSVRKVNLWILGSSDSGWPGLVRRVLTDPCLMDSSKKVYYW